MGKITKVVARQVLIAGEIQPLKQIFVKSLSSSAICPSGASTGTFEAFGKRDKFNKKYLGKSVFVPINFINKVI